MCISCNEVSSRDAIGMYGRLWPGNVVRRQAKRACHVPSWMNKHKPLRSPVRDCAEPNRSDAYELDLAEVKHDPENVRRFAPADLDLQERSRCHVQLTRRGNGVGALPFGPNHERPEQHRLPL
jgi:hypothetical protein